MGKGRDGELTNTSRYTIARVHDPSDSTEFNLFCFGQENKIHQKTPICWRCRSRKENTDNMKLWIRKSYKQ